MSGTLTLLISEKNQKLEKFFDILDSESQIEFITENGLEAWQTKVAEIKARYPK